MLISVISLAEMQALLHIGAAAPQEAPQPFALMFLLVRLALGTTSKKHAQHPTDAQHATEHAAHSYPYAQEAKTRRGGGEGHGPCTPPGSSL